MVFLSRFSHFEHFFYFGGADISCGHVFVFVAFREKKKEKGKKDQNRPTARQKPESRATPTAWSVDGSPLEPWRTAYTVVSVEPRQKPESRATPTAWGV